MKRADLYSFLKGLQMCKFEHPRLSYAVVKNRRKVEQVIKDMEETLKPDEQMQEFIKKREELAIKYSVKDENNVPRTREIVSDDGRITRFYVIEGQDDPGSPYRKELAELEKQYREAIDSHKAKIKVYEEEFLQEETDFEPFKVDLEFLEAHEKCPQEIMNLIFWMIKEPEN